jgi:hypothetical protein
MSLPYRVILESFPPKRREHIERVVHKHNRALTHHEYAALVERVGEGTASLVGSYVEAHVADNLVAELNYHGAKAHIESPEAT